ncbi:hypothetical protein DFH09DRAFT_1353874 [Mycena vulgaris]|nr:hypothetical protein DFH09DRAFT_1353874 [Mycena vulgaris]
MATSPPTFIPTARDVLLVVSHNAMGGSGLTHAFVFNPIHLDMGLLINRTGAVCEVGPEDWAELRRLASDAKNSVAQGGGGSWSRPQLAPFVPDRYHGNPMHIIHWRDGAEEIAGEIPSPLVELAKASSSISQKLLPYTYSQTQSELTSEARQMLEAVQDMSTAVRSDRALREELIALEEPV